MPLSSTSVPDALQPNCFKDNSAIKGGASAEEFKENRLLVSSLLLLFKALALLITQSFLQPKCCTGPPAIAVEINRSSARRKVPWPANMLLAHMFTPKARERICLHLTVFKETSLPFLSSKTIRSTRGVFICGCSS